MKQLLTIAFAAVLVAVASAGHIQYTVCSDSAYNCAGPSCVNVELPDSKCASYGNATAPKSQYLECTTFAGLCAVINYYPTPACAGQAMSKADLVCGECYPQDDGSFIAPKCLYTTTGEPRMNVTKCTDSKCRNCESIEGVVAGQCVPENTKSSFTKLSASRGSALKAIANPPGTASSELMGFRPCELIFRAAWDEASCNGTVAEEALIPADTCLNGAKLSCKAGPVV
jgi:hypothetical protein